MFRLHSQQYHLWFEIEQAKNKQETKQKQQKNENDTAIFHHGRLNDSAACRCKTVVLWWLFHIHDMTNPQSSILDLSQQYGPYLPT